jgi:glucose/arabinose dehydrogenase
MKMVQARLSVLAALAAVSLIACASETEVLVSTTAGSITTEAITAETTTTEITTSETTVVSEPSFVATLGTPITDYVDPVDIAVRQGITLQSFTSQSYIVERAGKIYELASDGTKGTEVLDISDLTIAEGEQGLLGLAFAPDGSGAYVNYTDLQGNTVIASFLISDDGSFNKSSQGIITTIKQPYPNHNGGDIMVDTDGAIYVFMGDGGSANDPERHALDVTSPLGKIWKLSPVDPQWIGEAWAVGLRNPWRASLDPITNDLWIADVGQDRWEEINVVPFDQLQGVSFGWSAREGSNEFNADQQALHETFTAVEPVYEYEHVDNNCSISGGVVYRGSQVPVTGTWYIFSDYCSGKVQALCVDEQRQNCGIVDLGSVERSVGVVADAQGEVWILSQNGLIVPIVAD